VHDLDEAAEREVELLLLLLGELVEISPIAMDRDLADSGGLAESGC
jgi:hypothetical protein